MGEETMRIGCLGLTGNPIHNGHIEAAEIIVGSGLVDQVWLILSYAHPFEKRGVACWEHRVHMARLRENRARGIIISLVEAEMDTGAHPLDKKSYTDDVLAYLRKTRPRHEFIWCVGSDIVVDGSYARWHRWNNLKDDEASILVVDRQSHPLPAGELPPPFRKVGDRAIADISSTQIREMARADERIAPFVGLKVADYIRKKKLYRE